MKRAIASVLILAVMSNLAFAGKADSALSVNPQEHASILGKLVEQTRSSKSCAELATDLERTKRVSSTDLAFLKQKCAELGTSPLPTMTQEKQSLRLDTRGGTRIYFKFVDFNKGIVEVNNEKLILGSLSGPEQWKKIQEALPTKVSRFNYNFFIPDAQAGGGAAVVAVLGLIAVVWYLYKVGKGIFYTDGVLEKGILACEQVRNDPIYKLGPKNRDELMSLIKLQQTLVEHREFLTNLRDSTDFEEPNRVNRLSSCLDDVRTRVNTLMTAESESAKETKDAFSAK